MTNPTPLSSAAQAVLDASVSVFWRPVIDVPALHHKSVAAALRAAADLLSKEVDAPKVDGMKYTGLWHSHDYLNAIAAELESQ